MNQNRLVIETFGRKANVRIMVNARVDLRSGDTEGKQKQYGLGTPFAAFLGGY